MKGNKIPLEEIEAAAMLLGEPFSVCGFCEGKGWKLTVNGKKECAHCLGERAFMGFKTTKYVWERM